MRYVLVTINYADGKEKDVDLTFASMEALIDYVRIEQATRLQKVNWSSLVVTVLPVMF